MNKIFNSDCLEGLKQLPDESVDCCVTSPPYFGLRNYGVDGQIGLERTPDEFIDKLVEIFSEVKRVLKPEGTLWLNLGDSYSTGSGGDSTKSAKQKSSKGTQFAPRKKVEGMKPKDLIGVPWMVAFALRSAGWYLRQDIIWHKPNPMPESVTDRCTKAHEYIFLLSKSQKYYYNHEAIKEPAVTPMNNKVKQGFGSSTGKLNDGDNAHTNNPGKAFNRTEFKNKRSVWNVSIKPFKEAHFATFPPDLIEPCILAGCPENGVVLDPFMGAGTTALVALKNSRNYIGFELNPEYVEIAEKRLQKQKVA